MVAPHPHPMPFVYCPVAVTPQATERTTELLGVPGNVGIVVPVLKNVVEPTLTGTPSVMPLGQDAPPVVEEQVTAVQLSPALAVSLTVAPSAAEGPAFANVTV